MILLSGSTYKTEQIIVELGCFVAVFFVNSRNNCRETLVRRTFLGNECTSNDVFHIFPFCTKLVWYKRGVRKETPLYYSI